MQTFYQYFNESNILPHGDSSSIEATKSKKLKKLTIEIADDPASLAKGLAGRKDIPFNHGVMFRWDKLRDPYAAHSAQRRSHQLTNQVFSGKNMHFNIYIIETDVNGKITEYQLLKQEGELTTITTPAFVFEVRTDWFAHAQKEGGLKKGSNIYSFIEKTFTYGDIAGYNAYVTTKLKGNKPTQITAQSSKKAHRAQRKLRHDDKTKMWNDRTDRITNALTTGLVQPKS